MSLPATLPSAPDRLALQSARSQIHRGTLLGILLLCTVAWLNATIHGFRMPWTPLTISDTNSGSGMRQAVFGLSGMTAAYLLISSRALGVTIVHHLPWVALGGFMVVSMTWSTNPTLTVKRSAIFMFGLFMMMTLVHCTPRPVLLMKRCVVFTAGTVACVSIGMSFALPMNCSSLASRPGLAGMASHPNTLGAVMFTGLLASLGWRPPLSLERLYLRLCQLAMFAAVFMTGSVTAVLVTIVGTLAYFAVRADSYRRGALALFAVALTLTVVIIGADDVKGWLFDVAERDESMSGRDTLWTDVLRAGLKRPVFGSGFGGFWYEGRGREITGTWNPRQAHNTYIDLIVDLGLVGMIWTSVLFFGTLWSATRRAIGPPGSERRRIVASLAVVPISLLGVYGWSQSFMLKLDQFSMATMLWSLLLLSNRDDNALEMEFPDE